jgi:FkbM family methyltransferase
LADLLDEIGRLIDTRIIQDNAYPFPGRNLSTLTGWPAHQSPAFPVHLGQLFYPFGAGRWRRARTRRLSKLTPMQASTPETFYEGGVAFRGRLSTYLLSAWLSSRCFTTRAGHHTRRADPSGAALSQGVPGTGWPRGRGKMDGDLIEVSGFWCRKDNLEQDLVIVQDIYGNDAYRTCLLPRRGPELVLDVGAHIGCFARKWHELNPEAQILCVEACPENIPALLANVGGFAKVLRAACTYEVGPVGLLNAVRPHCESTGGSMVVPLADLDSEPGQPGYVYWRDRRVLPKVTLEDLMALAGKDRIDILKLDCEGSEYSILGRTPSLGRIAFILGEYHSQARWDAFRADRLAGWDYGHMSMDILGRGGIFHYRNPSFQ